MAAKARPEAPPVTVIKPISAAAADIPHPVF